MQTAPGHKADLWLCSSIFGVVELLTRQLAIASLAVLTVVKHKYYSRYKMTLSHAFFFLYKEKTSSLFGRTLFCAVTLFVDSLSPDTP